MTRAALATSERLGRREGDATMRNSLLAARVVRGLVPLALGVFVAVAMSLPADTALAQRNRPQDLRMFAGARDCTRDPREMRDLDDTAYSNGAIRAAASCADNARGSSEQISYANFLAGKARRILAERNEACPARPSGGSNSCLQDAEQLFSAARGTANQALANRARLERARVLRLQKNFDAAAAELEQLRSLEPPALYEQAMVVLDRLAQRASENVGREPAASGRQDERLEALRFLRSGFSTPVTAPEYAYVTHRGPLRLASLANELGKEDVDSALFERVNLAQERFSVAQAAVSFLSGQGALAAEINFNAGRAQLRLAALRATPVREDCQETPRGAIPLNVSTAQIAFEAAQRNGSKDANWGIGCVRLVQGQFPGAVQAFEQALPAANERPVLPRSEYFIGLARAQAASGGANLGDGAEPEGQETRGALGSFRRALSAEQDPARTQRIRLELADVYRRMGVGGFPGDVEARALRTYTLVIDGTNLPEALGEANYQRGLLRAKRGDTRGARDDLRRASSFNGHPRQAAASFELSKLLESECGARGRGCPNATAVEAYIAADLAVRSSTREEEATRVQYRRQACLVRIRFGRTGDQGQAACTNVEGGAEGALYEGMFWLSEADRLTAWRQQNAWSSANQAFKRGSDLLAGSGQDPAVGDRSLRDLLNYGQRIVLFCLGGGGADTSPAPPGVPEYFVSNGVPMCSGGR